MKNATFSKWYLVFLYIAVCFTFSDIIFSLYKNNFFEKSELATIEYRFNNIKKTTNLNDIIIVKIDDYSIKKYGTPLPRDIYGFLLNKSKESGAKFVAFDAMFYTFNENDIKDLYLLNQIYNSQNVILSSHISPDKGGTVMKSDDTFRQYIIGEGLINTFGKEGTIFGTKLLYNDISSGYYIPILPLEIYAKLNNIKDIDSYISKNYKLYKGDLLINYAGGKDTFPSVSIADILEKDFDFSIFKNKIIFVGATYGASQDSYITPFHKSTKYGASDISTPGVEIHANVLNTLINKNNLVRKDFSYFMFISITFLISIFLIPIFSFIYLIIPLAVISFAIIYLSVMLFQKNYIIEIVPLFIMLLLSFIISISFKIIFETIEKKRIQGMFGKYLAPEVVKQLINARGELSVGGQTKTISIFFSDIANFTNISEKLSPEKLVLLLNDYFNKMVHIITKNNGIVDKYIGDAIMALFGTPLKMENHADVIVSSAIEMRKSIEELKPKWEEATGLEFNARIGINSGEVVVGNIGSNKMLQYTAIGDNVNLASRLEGVNKYYGTNIIISEFTYKLLKEPKKYIIRELDFIKVKGKDKPVGIFEVICFNSPEERQIMEMVTNFETALALYRSQNFIEAKILFDKFKSDTPSSIFSERCDFFIENPPHEGWDKVFTLKSK